MALVRLSCLFGLAATIASAQPNMPAEIVPRACQIGIFTGGADRFVSITALSDGHFYTFSDGHFGRVGAADSRVLCGGDTVWVDGAKLWPKTRLRETDTVFESNGTALAGRLLEHPSADAETPLIVYAHGSEETGWIEQMPDPYQMVGRGVSVFVYDKRGTGRSLGSYTQNFPLLADDLVAASLEAKRLAQGRFGRFGLIGLSQGGWIAPLAADRADAEFIGVGYGLVVDIREEDAEQAALHLRDAGFGEDALQAARKITDITARIVTSGYQDGLDDLDAAREAYGDEPWFPLLQDGYTGVLLSMPTDDIRRNGIPMFDRLDVDWSLDPMEVMRGVEVPQMWALAGEDREAPIATTLERLQTLRSEGRDLSIYLFPDTDHGMVDYRLDEDGDRIPTRVTEGYYDLMADWAKGTLGPEYGLSSAQ